MPLRDRPIELMRLALLACLALVSFSGPAARAETLWFPQGGELFHKLQADPEEVQTAGEYFQHQGANEVDFSVGNNWGVRRWLVGKEKDWPIQADISGVVHPRFNISSTIGMDAIDFIINFPIEVRHGIFSGRFSLFHKSAHLGDNFIERTGRKRIGYSREGLQSLLSVEPSSLVRIYFGGTRLVHTIPDVGETTVQGGLELRSPDLRVFLNHECYLYLAQDMQSKEEVGWNVNSDTQFGLMIGFPGITRKLRLFTNYFTGHSTFGQFFREKESILGIGFGFDF